MHIDPTLWVAIAFGIFVLLAWKAVSRTVSTGLDARTNHIQAELDEAIRLKEEAQEILASYQQKQKEVLEEAAHIVAKAKEDADRMVRDAHAELEASIKKRLELTVNKISTYEASVLQEVRNQAIDAAIKQVDVLLKQRLTESTEQELLKNSSEQILRTLQ